MKIEISRQIHFSEEECRILAQILEDHAFKLCDQLSEEELLSNSTYSFCVSILEELAS